MFGLDNVIYWHASIVTLQMRRDIEIVFCGFHFSLPENRGLLPMGSELLPQAKEIRVRVIKGWGYLGVLFTSDGKMVDLRSKPHLRSWALGCRKNDIVDTSDRDERRP